MKKALLGGAALLLGVLISFGSAAAQGPAGAGAAAAAQESSHSADSLNPIKLFKKDSKNTSEPLRSRSDYEAKLTPKMQAEGLLGSYASLTEACSPYTELYDCLAGLHASHDVGVDFNCVRAAVSDVHTTANVSNCKVADGDKQLSLAKAIRVLKPDANSKQAAKDAEEQARDDIKAAQE
ncbi:MAG: hypothetical protein ACRD40_11715 [Candidatus Acidiferrales bacterium]